MTGAAVPPALCVGAMHWDVIARSDLPILAGGDAPGTVRRRPGGVALNVALALAALGRPVAMLGVVGADQPGGRLIEAVAAQGVDCAGVSRRGRTDRYVAIEAPDGALVAAVADCGGLEAAGEDLIAPLRDGALGSGPWLGTVVADGNLGADVLEALAAEPMLAGSPLALVPASPAKAGRIARAGYRGRAALYLNHHEAEAICRRGFPDAPHAAAALVEAGWVEAVVTDGPRRAAHAGPHGMVSADPPHSETRSVTGAGDVFVATHLAARGEGRDAKAALAAALAAAAAHVGRRDG